LDFLRNEEKKRYREADTLLLNSTLVPYRAAAQTGNEKLFSYLP
jgi:hypothetical protein